MESFWSTSVMKKKKFRFGVELKISSVYNYATGSGTLFAKVRLEERANGDFEANTERVNVRNHRVTWDQTFPFTCKMYAKPQVGILEECVLRVSIRKEGKTGKTEKLGYASLNLAELAGVGPKERRCLLQSYDVNNLKGQDNSILVISLNVTLQQGDPVFLRPVSTSPSFSSVDPELDERSYAGSLKSSSASEQSGPSPTSGSGSSRPPQLFQNFLSRRGSIMPSILTNSFMRDSKGVKEAPEVEEKGKCGFGDAISIGSNELSAELLDVDNTLVAEASTGTILAGTEASFCEDSMQRCLPSPAEATQSRHSPMVRHVPGVTVHPTSVVSLDSAFESTSSSTALQHSMNCDHLSLSSSTNTSSLRFSSPDLDESVTDDRDRGRLAMSANGYLAAEASDAFGSGSTSAPATVRRGRSSFRPDARGMDDVKYNSLETSSRQGRMRRSSRPGIESANPSLKSSGRSSVVSMNRDSVASIQQTLDRTRIDASDVIDSLLSKSSGDLSENKEGKADRSGLQLYIGSDGSTTVGGKTLHDRPMSAAHYRKVVVNPDA
eukprot:scpid37235/ scgid24166/ Protein FAM102A; Early estrogen-induced gene 1 protein